MDQFHNMDKEKKIITNFPQITGERPKSSCFTYNSQSSNIPQTTANTLGPDYSHPALKL